MKTKIKTKAKRTPADSANTSLYKLVPNMMTIAALIAGMTSIQYAIDERWERAVLAIVIAAFIDAFDGAAARLLNASSRLGAELDSLSDFLCFGVAPATILYLWILQDAGKIGWITALAFAIAAALRLARFNAEDKESLASKPKPTKKSKAKKTGASGYFKGVPAPTSAGMTILPMILSFQFMDIALIEKIVTDYRYVAAWMILFAILMVSRIPTLSTKHIKLGPKLIVPVLALFGLMIAGLIHATWITLTIMGIVYGLSLPLAAMLSLKDRT